MDRDDLIKALGNAYADKKEETDPSKIVSAVAGEKDVLRLLTKNDKSSQKNLYQNHPDVVVINQLADELASANKNDVSLIGRELIIKFNRAVEANDEKKITEIVEKSKELYKRLQRTDRSSPECALIYMMISDTIKKL